MATWIVTLAVAVILLPMPLCGQSGATTGEIRGVVQDASGGVLPGAKLSLHSDTTGLTRMAASDSNGTYRFPLLPPGLYQVKAEMQGFATVTRKELPVRVGDYLPVDFHLVLAAVPQELEVKGTTSIVESLRSQQAQTVTERSINELPINGRNFLDFALLTPGVVEVNTNVPLAKQLPTSGLSFGGQNGRGNAVTVDGADNMDASTGAVRATPSQEAVLEYQVNSNSFHAEFGRASAGVINIVTRSGTNDWHGNLFLFHRNQSIQARNFFAGEKPKFHRNQPGFTVSGPLQRDHTFLFLAYEGLLRREPAFVNILGNPAILKPTPQQAPLFDFLKRVPAAALVQAGLSPDLPVLFDLSPSSPVAATRQTYNMLAAFDGAKATKLDRNVASLKLDHRFENSDTLTIRHIWSLEKSSGNYAGGLTAVDRGTSNVAGDNSLVAAYTHLIGPNLLNEFRFQFARRVYDVDTIDRFGPAVSIKGVAEFGRDWNLDSDRLERRLQWTDGLTRTHGRHTTKFGADVNYLWSKTRSPMFMGGSFDFQNPGNALPLGLAINTVGVLAVAPDSPLAMLDGVSRLSALLTGLGQQALIPSVVTNPAAQPLTSLQMFVLGLPRVYNQGFGNPLDSFSSQQLGFFFQDGIRVQKRLNLNFGLRYDVEVQPEPMHRDWNNLGPRFGLSYGLRRNNTTILRAGYGVFYQPLYQAVAFTARVLNTEQIVNMVRTLDDDMAGRVGAAAIWQYELSQGLIGRRTLSTADLATFGLKPGRDSRVIQGVTSNLVNPYTHQGSLGLEQHLGQDLSAEIDYTVVRGVKLLRNNISNLRPIGERIIQAGGQPGGQPLDFGPIFTPVDPTILTRFVIGTEASSIYHGMTARVNRRYRGHYHFLASYTLGKVIDDATDISQSLAPQNPLNARAERSLSSFDVRHRLALSGALDSPFRGRALRGFTLAPILTYRSGYPFNLLLGVDPGTNNFNATNTQRPAACGRNTGRGPGYQSADLRLSRKLAIHDRLRIELVAEVFNLLNRTNFKSVNGTVNSFVFPYSTFSVTGIKGKPTTDFLGFTSAYDPRQFQLAVKLRF
jgi:hypothetical protein